MALNSSTSAEPQATSSTRAEQLDRLHELQQLVDALLDAADEISLLAQEIADEDQDQDEVLDAAQDLIHEVDIAAPVAGALRYLTSAVKDEWAPPGDLPDEGDESGDKNDGAAA